MKAHKIPKNLVNILGGFVALVGCFLPFEAHRSLFLILQSSPLPFFSPALVLLAVLAMVLYALGQPEGASVLGLLLFLGWGALFCLLLRIYSPSVLGQLKPGAFLLPPGLLALALYRL